MSSQTDIQVKEDVKEAYSEYERIHKQWMNTRVDLNAELCKRLSEARQRYLSAVKTANPTWIVM